MWGHFPGLGVLLKQSANQCLIQMVCLLQTKLRDNLLMVATGRIVEMVPRLGNVAGTLQQGEIRGGDHGNCDGADGGCGIGFDDDRGYF